MSTNHDPFRDSTVVLLTCSECGNGHYELGLGGGSCSACGHVLLWSDVNLDPGESPAAVYIGGHEETRYMGYRIADDTRGE